MSNLEWRDGNFPVSTRFDDPYYSRADGRLEASYVFVQGNDLPERWRAMGACTIAELGFGTGLNFLETVFQWRQIRGENDSLHFISFEQFPITAEDIDKALSYWPELSDLTSQLLEIWNPNFEIIDEDFDDHVRLTVFMSDANTRLPQLELAADAWYLDGFSPAKNPELWGEALMQNVGKSTKLNGTFATYTAAGFVKRSLQAAGFDVTKTKGFGTKRDMLVGMKQNNDT